MMFDPDDDLGAEYCPVCLVLTPVTQMMQRDGGRICEECADRHAELRALKEMARDHV